VLDSFSPPDSCDFLFVSELVRRLNSRVAGKMMPVRLLLGLLDLRLGEGGGGWARPRPCRSTATDRPPATVEHSKPHLFSDSFCPPDSAGAGRDVDE